MRRRATQQVALGADDCNRHVPHRSLAPRGRLLLFSKASQLNNPGDPEKGERSSLFRVLARTPFNSCVQKFVQPLLCCGRLQARRRTERLPTIHLPSTCARAPFAARLDARALRWSCARTPKSGQLVPVQRPTDGAECARVLRRWCGGEGADAARRAAQPAPNVVPWPAA